MDGLPNVYVGLDADTTDGLGPFFAVSRGRRLGENFLTQLQHLVGGVTYPAY